jgi:hypothetical protein
LRAAVLTFCLFGLLAAQASATTISAQTHTARAGEAFTLFGKGLVGDSLIVDDGTATAAATQLFTAIDYAAMATVPVTMSTGTLWVATDDGVNSVTLNSPEPWFVYPDDPDIGDTIRIFGRNLWGTSPTATLIMQSLTTPSTQFEYEGTVTSSYTISVTLGTTDRDGATLLRDGYNYWIDEPKLGGDGRDYGPPGMLTTFSVIASYSHPATSCTITDAPYNAVANDATHDTAAFAQAISDVNTSGGGTIHVPAGTFEIDETQLANSSFLDVAEGVWIQGAGAGTTTLAFDPVAMVDTEKCIRLVDNCSLSSMTLITSGSLWDNLGTQGPWVVEIDGSNARGERSYLQNVTIRTDDATSGKYWISPLLCTQDRVEVTSVGVYASRMTYFEACVQVKIDGLRYYGATDTTSYNVLPGSLSSFGAPPIKFAKGRGNIVENCVFAPRGGPMRRGIVWQIGSPTGGAEGYYVAGNTISLVSTPWTNEGEGIHLETSEQPKFMGTGVTVTSPTRIVLPTGLTSYQAQDDFPLFVTVTTGTGVGQVRYAWAITSKTLDLDRSLLVSPDAASTVLVQVVLSRSIIYDNTLTSTAYPEAAQGVAMSGPFIDCTFSSNTFSGWRQGFSEYVQMDLGDTGLASRPKWFLEVLDNTFVDCVQGIFLTISSIDDDNHQDIGNVYRDNTISTLNPWPQHSGSAYEMRTGIGMDAGLNTRSNFAPSDTVFGLIFEGNAVDSGLHGWYMRGYGEWIASLKNTFTGATSASITWSSDIADYVESGETSNTLPIVTINNAAIGVRARQMFRYIHTPFRHAPTLSHDIYAYDSDGAGTFTITVSDPDGDTVTSSVAGVTGMTLTNDEIAWTGLTDGLHRATLSMYDGTETGTRIIYLVTGTYETFDDGTTITTVDSLTTTVETAITTYTCTAASGFHNVAEQQHSGFTKTLDVTPNDQTVTIQGPADGTKHNTAALAATINSYGTYAPDGYAQTLRMRLHQDATNYYEFRDIRSLNENTDWPRYINKVVAGSESTSVSAIAAHNVEGVATLELSGQAVTFRGWGDTLTLTDTTPLDIDYWEIDFEYVSGANNYLTLDDIAWGFRNEAGAGSGITQNKWTAITTTCRYVPELEWSIPVGDGTYDETSTLTLTGNVLSLIVEPGSSEDTFNLRMMLGNDDLLTSGSETDWITCRNKAHTISAYTVGLSSGQVRIRATGLDDALTLKVLHTEGL